MLCLKRENSGLAIETYIRICQPPVPRRAPGSRVSGWQHWDDLTNLATLVSRTVKATFLVAASAPVLGTQDAINVPQINQEIVLKVTDLISLKCTAGISFPGSVMWLWENHGTLVWGGPVAPFEPSSALLCFSFREIGMSTKSSPLIHERYSGNCSEEGPLWWSAHCEQLLVPLSSASPWHPSTGTMVT